MQLDVETENRRTNADESALAISKSDVMEEDIFGN